MSGKSGRHKSIAKTLASGVQRYILRISLKGVLQFNCPYCGHFNTARVQVWTWRVRCAGSADVPWGTEPGPESSPAPKRASNSKHPRIHHCNRWFIYFLGLIPIPPGRCVRPSDTIPNASLLERHPLGEFIRSPRWLSGDAVSRLIDYPDHPPFCCLHNIAGECGRIPDSQSIGLEPLEPLEPITNAVTEKEKRRT